MATEDILTAEELYRSEVRCLPRLSIEEEQKIVRRAREGDAEACTALLTEKGFSPPQAAVVLTQAVGRVLALALASRVKHLTAFGAKKKKRRLYHLVASLFVPAKIEAWCQVGNGHVLRGVWGVL